MSSSVGSPSCAGPATSQPFPGSASSFSNLWTMYVCVIKDLGFCRTILSSRSEGIKLTISVVCAYDFRSFLPSLNLYSSSLLNCLFREVKSLYINIHPSRWFSDIVSHILVAFLLNFKLFEVGTDFYLCMTSAGWCLA